LFFVKARMASSAYINIPAMGTKRSADRAMDEASFLRVSSLLSCIMLTAMTPVLRDTAYHGDTSRGELVSGVAADLLHEAVNHEETRCLCP
jgi:hypothetical protein